MKGKGEIRQKIKAAVLRLHVLTIIVFAGAGVALWVAGSSFRDWYCPLLSALGGALVSAAVVGVIVRFCMHELWLQEQLRKMLIDWDFLQKMKPVELRRITRDTVEAALGHRLNDKLWSSLEGVLGRVSGPITERRSLIANLQLDSRYQGYVLARMTHIVRVRNDTPSKKSVFPDDRVTWGEIDAPPGVSSPTDVVRFVQFEINGKSVLNQVSQKIEWTDATQKKVSYKLPYHLEVESGAHVDLRYDEEKLLKNVDTAIARFSNFFEYLTVEVVHPENFDCEIGKFYTVPPRVVAEEKKQIPKRLELEGIGFPGNGIYIMWAMRS